MQNLQNQGISQAMGASNKLQGKATHGLKDKLPDSIRESHALDDGNDSKVPKGLQKAVPEKLERALPNKIHNTGDE
ncbi:hypothetical protein BDV18DRAFT_156344 [Aspergillus unguis]